MKDKPTLPQDVSGETLGNIFMQSPAEAITAARARMLFYYTKGPPSAEALKGPRDEVTKLKSSRASESVAEPRRDAETRRTKR